MALRSALYAYTYLRYSYLCQVDVIQLAYPLYVALPPSW